MLQQNAALEVEHRREGVRLLHRADLEDERSKDHQGRCDVLPVLEHYVQPRGNADPQLRPVEDLLERTHGTEPAAEVAPEHRGEAEERQGADQMSGPATDGPVGADEHEEAFDGLDGSRRGPLQEPEQDDRRDDQQAPGPASPWMEQQRRRRQERAQVDEELEAPTPVRGPEAEGRTWEEGDDERKEEEDERDGAEGLHVEIIADVTRFGNRVSPEGA